MDFGDAVPFVSVDVVESETLSTIKPITYEVGEAPNLLQGTNPTGGLTELAADDDTYYKVADDGNPPSVIYEVTSETIGFDITSFGEIRIVAKSSKSSTRLEAFVYNPDDPTHTADGYNPIADATSILEVANTEQTISFGLEDADVDYLNATSTKKLKIKITATRTGGFILRTDQVLFTIAGVATTDQRDVAADPVINVGTLRCCGADEMIADDTAYYKVKSVGQVLEFEVISDNFAFSALDTVSIPYILRSDRNDVVVEVYVFNPDDPAHTDGGYDTEPDLTTTIPMASTDISLNAALVEEDIAYLNTLFPIFVKLKIRATHASNEFQLHSDLIKFIATSTGGLGQVLRQTTHQYIDPGLKNPAMAQIEGKEGYLLRIHSAQPGIGKISWNSHAEDFSGGRMQIHVFRGLVVRQGVVMAPGNITDSPPSQDNDLVLFTKGDPGETHVQTDYFEVDRGLYTIVFFNPTQKTRITEPFAATGEKADTWIYMPAYKDYLIDVNVGIVGLRAIIRQSPGPTEPPIFPWSETNINWIENQVTIQSWEPYGVLQPNRDDD